LRQHAEYLEPICVTGTIDRSLVKQVVRTHTYNTYCATLIDGIYSCDRWMTSIARVLHGFCHGFVTRRKSSRHSCLRQWAFDYTLTSQYEPTRKITRYDTKVMDAFYYDGHVNFLYFVLILSLSHLFRVCVKLELVFFFFANNQIQKKISLKLKLDIFIYMQEYYNLFKKILILIWLNLYWLLLFFLRL